MKRIITTLLLSTSLTYAVDVDLGKLSDLTWQGSGTTWWSVFGGTTQSVWQIPEYASSVLYYKFDEATNSSGQVVDSSYATTGTGTVSGADYYPSSNGISACYGFVDSSDDYIKTTQSGVLLVGATNFIISAWHRWTASTAPDSYNCLLSNRGGELSGLYQGSASAGTLRSQLWVKTNERNGPKLYDKYVWRHTIWYKSNGYDYVYVNGALDYTFSSEVTNALIASASWHLGHDTGATGYGWDGLIDEVAMWVNPPASDVSAMSTNIYQNTYQYHGWSNSLALSNPSLYSNTVLEVLGEYNYPADTSYIGTNHMTSYTGGNAYDPAWQADGTNGWWNPANDYLQRATALISSSSTNYAMACRFKAIATNQARQVLMTVNSANTNNAINIELQLDKLAFTTHNQGFTNVVGTTVINTNEWIDVAVSCANTTGTIYLNGALEASGTVSAVTNLSRTESCAINNTLFFNGSIDNLRIFNRAISQAEADKL